VSTCGEVVFQIVNIRDIQTDFLKKFIRPSWYNTRMTKNDARIKMYLLKLGFQPNLKGYHLLARLISLAAGGEDIMPLKYKGYRTLAEEFGVGSASVEKDIQNAISSAWLRGDVDVLYKEFGETLDEEKGKPTNKQFVLTVLERLSSGDFADYPTAMRY
jgi:two-component system response regulator (stage 0 sporulation protein A)